MIWDIVKLFYIVFLMMYVVFSLVVIRQVAHMTETLEVGFEKLLRFVSYLHLLFAVGVLVVAVVIL